MLCRNGAFGLALFVTFLWSTSFVIVKWIFPQLGPLMLAGLRYTIAALSLLGYAGLTRRRWPVLPRNLGLPIFVIGLLGYALNQGGIAVALYHLPAAAVSFLLNFGNTVVTIIVATLLFQEKLTAGQLAGASVVAAAGFLYYFPVGLAGINSVGLIATGIVAVSYALWVNLSRQLLRGKDVDPLVLTIYSMGVGGAALLTAGIIFESWPPTLSASSWTAVVWLALVNTALAFALWNYTQRVLQAFESALLNSSMLVQITIMAALWLDEPVTIPKAAAVFLATMGLLLVNGKILSGRLTRLPGYKG